jgi:hypothetical protein
VSKSQFRILYRQFLFRIVDLELLSPQGEISKLLGQFGSLLVVISLLFSLPVLALADSGARATSWSTAQFLVATTMLAVGLFSVLSWDSMFPDRRDVLTLAPLPVRASTLFFAKTAAVATGLGVPVVALNVGTGLLAPVGFAPVHPGVLGMGRSFAAYWITMLLAGEFIFCSVLGAQGLAALLLSRRRFLRVSSFLQMAAFCLFVGVYFLEPSLASPDALIAARNHHWLTFLPSYWFLGLFEQLNGSMQAALVPLAGRAWIALAIGGCATTLVYLLSFFRTLRRIAEEPDIVPRFRGSSWLPRFGGSLDTAVGQFSVRTLLRSRQHRLILAFYLGMGFALTTIFIKMLPAHQQLWVASSISPWRHPNAPLIVSSVLMMFFGVIGTRALFAMPLDLRANWIFRITPIGELPKCLAADRRALLVLAVAPIWVGSAAVFLRLWPWPSAAGHLVILALLGVLMAEITLAGFHKIPFTCSYLPGKSNVNRTFWVCIGFFVLLLYKAAAVELHALEDPASYTMIITILVLAAILARWRTATLARSEVLVFEQLPPPAVLVLGLDKAGTRRL